ncbi:MAG: hypothetical protein GWP59_01360 [Chlamydiales bacterium]|nr:hypothetical protein [Chlamydiales bacterium]NCF70326.1 hypothetical protein [Chlamydiales bacterium]
MRVRLQDIPISKPKLDELPVYKNNPWAPHPERMITVKLEFDSEGKPIKNATVLTDDDDTPIRAPGLSFELLRDAINRTGSGPALVGMAKGIGGMAVSIALFVSAFSEE